MTDIYNQKIIPFGNTETGFTIIEIVVAVALFTLVAGGVIALVSNVLAGSSKQGTLLADTDQARRLTAQLTGELRNATTSGTGSYALEKVAAQELIFYANVDEDTAIERVRYYLQNGKMYRGIVNPAGSPLTYNPAAEVAIAIQNDVGNGATALFYYYNGSYNGVTDTYLAQPVNVTDVRYVKLNLQISNKAGFAANKYYTVTASAALRNLKDNLGN